MRIENITVGFELLIHYMKYYMNEPGSERSYYDERESLFHVFTAFFLSLKLMQWDFHINPFRNCRNYLQDSLIFVEEILI